MYILKQIHIMTKNKMNKRANKQAKRNKNRTRMMVPRAMLDKQAAAYRQLLLDPCGGPLVGPTVSGPGTGLYTRQKYYIAPTVSSLSTVSSLMDVAIKLTPATGEVFWRATDGTNTSSATVSLETGVLASTLARSYRAVAACIKWIPNGPINTRSGIVALGYVPDNITITTPFVGGSAGGMFPLCQRITSNTGMGDTLEARWFPSGPEDLEFRQRDVVYNADTGSTLVILQSVDAVQTGVAPTLTTNLRGQFEVTVVWEWTPDATAGVSSSLHAGSTNSLQQVLSTMGELTRAAVDSAYVTSLMGRAGRAMLTGVTNFVAQRAYTAITPPSFTIREL